MKVGVGSGGTEVDEGVVVAEADGVKVGVYVRVSVAVQDGVGEAEGVLEEVRD